MIHIIPFGVKSPGMKFRYIGVFLRCNCNRERQKRARIGEMFTCDDIWSLSWVWFVICGISIIDSVYNTVFIVLGLFWDVIVKVLKMFTSDIKR